MASGGPLSKELLEQGLKRHVAGVARVVSCERLSGGANQETYRIEVEGQGVVAQFAVRRSVGGLSVPAMPGYPGLRAEALLMRTARQAGVPEPEVHWIFEPEDGIGDGFLMEWLDGETLGKRIVSSDDLADARTQLAFQCGETLARIHSIDISNSDIADVLDRITPDLFLEQTWARYRNFDVAQPMIDYTAVWLRERLPSTPELRVVHNDFRNGNIMVSPDGIVAVLDWELAHIGDPMRDLGWLCTNSWRFGRSELPVGGFGTYEDLFRGYESVSGQPVDRDRVKFWEVFGSFWWAVGCLEMANAYRTGIDRGVERAAIGRRTSECQVDCVNLLIPGPVELIAPDTSTTSSDMPRSDEIIESVANFLRNDVMPTARGRTKFLARVAANALDILGRDDAAGVLHRAAQCQRLRALLDREGDLATLNAELVRRLRDGSIPLDYPGLIEHLRQSVVNQVAIDQPKYSGLATALIEKKGSG